MRLPGTGGIPDVTVVSDKVYLYVPRHSPAIFVDRVDYVSGLGHIPGREHGSGPRYLVTDLGEFDWNGGIMRLVRRFPSVEAAHIQRKTGFPLAMSDAITETPPPTAHELRLLREVIDPLGVRKLETLGGGARKELLRTILTAEQAR